MVCHNLFILSDVEGGIFQLFLGLRVVNNAAVTLICKFCVKRYVLISLGKCSGVGFQGHIVILCLTL